MTGIEVAQEIAQLVVYACGVIAAAHVAIVSFTLLRRGAAQV